MKAHERQRRDLLHARARYACEYCRITEELAGGRLTEDHILPSGVGGADTLHNLCLCCWWCNIYKHEKVAATDPVTGRVVPVFHPRIQIWEDHFRWSQDGLHIIGRTDVGRATVEALHVNDADRLNARRFWMQHGIHPYKKVNKPTRSEKSR